MTEDFDFTDDEIREELAKLGYYDIAPSRLLQFKKDLERLVQHDRSRNTSYDSGSSGQTPTDSDQGEHPKFDKDRVPLENGAILHSYPTSSYHLRAVTDKENLYFDDDWSSATKPRLRRQVDTVSDGTRFIKIPDVNDTLSETDSERRYMRRKTLRKNKDGSKKIDESVTESEVGSLAELEDRLEEVRLSDYMFMPPSRGSTRRSATAASVEAPYRLDPDDPRPPSVILRRAEHPHTRNLKKCDPVNRYQQFRQSWSANQVPGEKSHKRLRWNVREQMLCQDTMEFKRPQKTYIPNSYIVPTEKKRSALRWQVRMDMAHGNVPVTDNLEEF